MVLCVYLLKRQIRRGFQIEGNVVTESKILMRVSILDKKNESRQRGPLAPSQANAGGEL